MMLRRVHLIVGLAALAFFSATGLYLRWHEPPLASLEVGSHLLLRSGHVYLLFSGLLNVVASFHAEIRRSRGVFLVGSVLLLGSPMLVAIGFCLESTGSVIERPLTKLGVVSAGIAVLLQLIGFIMAARKPRPL